MLKKEDILLNLLGSLDKGLPISHTRKLLKMRNDIFILLLKEAIGLKLLIKNGNKYSLSEKGKNFVKQSKYKFFRCGYRAKVPKEILLETKKYCRLRKKPNVEIDQCPTAPEDLAQRVIFMNQNGDLNNKRILCIGDNDFASLLMFKIGKPKEVVIIDMDEQVLNTIKKIANKQNWAIKIKRFDIRKFSETNRLKQLEDKFDVFQTDPPYTETGFKYYLALGMMALKRKGSCYIIAPHMNLENWSDELLYEIEKFILDHGFFITDIISSFQSFVDKYGIISSIIRAERTNFAKEPFVALKQLNIDKFYTIR